MQGDFEKTLDVNRRLAPLRVIGVGLIAAPIIFAGIAWVMAQSGATGQPGTSAPPWPSLGAGGGGAGGQMDLPTLLRLVWAALAISELPALIFIRQAMLGRAAAVHRNAPQVRGADTVTTPIFSIFTTWTIIALALPESLALFGGTVIMFSGHPLDGVLVAVPVLVMLALFPTRGKWEAFERSAQTRAAIAR